MNKAMKNLWVVILIILGSVKANAQSVSTSDSLKIMEAIEQVFQMFEKPDYAQFEKSSTDWIYCILCRQRPHPRHYYMMRRKDFFENHMESLKEFEDFRKAKVSTQVWLEAENNKVSDITAFVLVWKKDEYQVGSEGSCLGINFKRHGNGFQFSGIETIP